MAILLNNEHNLHLSSKIYIKKEPVNTTAFSIPCAKEGLSSYLMRISTEWTVQKLHQGEEKNLKPMMLNLTNNREKNHCQTILSSKFYLLCMTF